MTTLEETYKLVTPEQAKSIIDAWKARRADLYKSRKSNAYHAAKLEFLMGAQAVLNTQGLSFHTMFLACMSVGRDVDEFYKD